MCSLKHLGITSRAAQFTLNLKPLSPLLSTLKKHKQQLPTNSWEKTSFEASNFCQKTTKFAPEKPHGMPLKGTCRGSSTPG